MQFSMTSYLRTKDFHSQIFLVHQTSLISEKDPSLTLFCLESWLQELLLVHQPTYTKNGETEDLLRFFTYISDCFISIVPSLENILRSSERYDWKFLLESFELEFPCPSEFLFNSSFLFEGQGEFNSS